MACLALIIVAIGALFLGLGIAYTKTKLDPARALEAKLGGVILGSMGGLAFSLPILGGLSGHEIFVQGLFIGGVILVGLVFAMLSSVSSLGWTVILEHRRDKLVRV